MAILLRPKQIAVMGLEPANKTDFSLEELYQFIDCDCIELVALVDDYYMVIDEHGKLKNLPPNVSATILFHSGGGDKSDYIAGPALLIKKDQIK